MRSVRTALLAVLMTLGLSAPASAFELLITFDEPEWPATGCSSPGDCPFGYVMGNEGLPVLDDECRPGFGLCLLATYDFDGHLLELRPTMDPVGQKLYVQMDIALPEGFFDPGVAPEYENGVELFHTGASGLAIVGALRRPSFGDSVLLQVSDLVDDGEVVRCQAPIVNLLGWHEVGVEIVLSRGPSAGECTIVWDGDALVDRQTAHFGEDSGMHVVGVVQHVLGERTNPAAVDGSVHEVRIDDVCITETQEARTSFCVTDDVPPPGDGGMDDGGTDAGDSAVADSGGSDDAGGGDGGGIADFRGAGGCNCETTKGPRPKTGWPLVAFALVALSWRLRTRRR